MRHPQYFSSKRRGVGLIRQSESGQSLRSSLKPSAAAPVNFNPRRYAWHGRTVIDFRRELRNFLIDELNVIRLCYLPQWRKTLPSMPPTNRMRYDRAWRAAVHMIEELMSVKPRLYTQGIPNGRQLILRDHTFQFKGPESYIPPPAMKQKPDRRRRPGGQASKRLAG